MENCKTTIVDAMCGKGKTSWAIQTMNENTDKRYIFITPFLDEIQRVMNACDNRVFYEPNNKNKNGSKLDNFNELLSKGKNIASTHALFSIVNEDTLKYLQENEYTLILDEAYEVIRDMKIKKSDREILLSSKVIDVDEHNRITWIDKSYDGKLNEYKRQIEQGEVYLMNDRFMFWTFPIKVLQAIENTYVLTYLFDGQLQRYYYDMHKVQYEYKSVESYEREELDKDLGVYINKRYRLCDYDPHEDSTSLSNLINIYEGKLNNIGKNPTDKRKSLPLCKSWYDKNAKLDGIDVLKRNTYNYFKNICKAKSNEVLWTTYKDYVKTVKPQSYGGNTNDKCKDPNKKRFIPWNTRATNDYRDRTNVAFLCNIYKSPIIIEFFKQQGIEINQNLYALSELIQFMFRSAIRDGKAINIYVPSQRMRELLINWLDGVNISDK